MKATNAQGTRVVRRFSDDAKRDAVRLVVEENYTFASAAAAVGVCNKTLRDWHKKFAPPLQPCDENATQDEMRAEIKLLRSQLRRAELEREILKKATAYFARESQ